jgi:hypothetical protein
VTRTYREKGDFQISCLHAAIELWLERMTADARSLETGTQLSVTTEGRGEDEIWHS